MQESFYNPSSEQSATQSNRKSTKQSHYFKRLVQFTLLLAVVVIVLGAYTRLSNAGLGCPDWPGCYGFLAVPHADQVPPELGLLETGKAINSFINDPVGIFSYRYDSFIIFSST